MPPVILHGYAIYRRVDEEPLQRRVRESSEVPAGFSAESPHLTSYGERNVRVFDDREFVLGNSGARGSEFPPGIWEGVGWVLAGQTDSYQVTVATAADSSGMGTHWSVYFVAAHTTTPSLWYASEPDSGYSVDNIAPAVPGGLVFANDETLTWDAALESDFEYHTVYGSGTEVFDETATLIAYTVETMFDISADPRDYYHVTTSDRGGNESDAATIGNATTSSPNLPSGTLGYVLHGAQPNPSRAGTRIGFDLPAETFVQLTIHDAGGRVVRKIADQVFEAGRHDLYWAGGDDAGEAVAAGVYFARIAAGEFRGSQRLVVVR